MRTLALVALLSLAAAAQAPGTKLLAPIKYKQVTILPVVRTGESGPSNYLSLKEGLAKKLVHVSEKPGGAEVNRVQVKNQADRSLLLLGGEIILGGQQDRIIGKDQLVPPGESALVEVYCVEHGRWSGARAFGASGGMVEPSVRAEAKYASNQQQVWDKVAGKTAALGAQTSTGTYRAIGEKAQTSIAPYREAIVPQLKKLDGVVGIAAAVNGRITQVELFATPELFAQYRDQILDSIFVGAATVPEESAAPPARAGDVEQFMKKAHDAKPKEMSRNKAGVSEERDAKDVGASSITPAGAAAPVYESIQIK